MVLLPIMWNTGTESGIFQRIAAPMIRGMASSTLLVALILIAAITGLLKARALPRPEQSGRFNPAMLVAAPWIGPTSGE